MLRHAVFQRQGGLDVHAGSTKLHLMEGDLEAHGRGALHGGTGRPRPVAVLPGERGDDLLDSSATEATIDRRAQRRERRLAWALVETCKHSVDLGTLCARAPLGLRQRV